MRKGLGRFAKFLSFREKRAAVAALVFVLRLPSASAGDLGYSCDNHEAPNNKYTDKIQASKPSCTRHSTEIGQAREKYETMVQRMRAEAARIQAMSAQARDSRSAFAAMLAAARAAAAQYRADAAVAAELAAALKEGRKPNEEAIKALQARGKELPPLLGQEEMKKNQDLIDQKRLKRWNLSLKPDDPQVQANNRKIEEDESDIKKRDAEIAPLKDAVEKERYERAKRDQSTVIVASEALQKELEALKADFEAKAADLDSQASALAARENNLGSTGTDGSVTGRDSTSGITVPPDRPRTDDTPGFWDRMKGALSAPFTGARDDVPIDPDVKSRESLVQDAIRASAEPKTAPDPDFVGPVKPPDPKPGPLSPDYGKTLDNEAAAQYRSVVTASGDAVDDIVAAKQAIRDKSEADMAAARAALGTPEQATTAASNYARELDEKTARVRETQAAWVEATACVSDGMTCIPQPERPDLRKAYEDALAERNAAFNSGNPYLRAAAEDNGVKAVLRPGDTSGNYDDTSGFRKAVASPDFLADRAEAERARLAAQDASIAQAKSEAEGTRRIEQYMTDYRAGLAARGVVDPMGSFPDPARQTRDELIGSGDNRVAAAAVASVAGTEERAEIQQGVEYVNKQREAERTLAMLGGPTDLIASQQELDQAKATLRDLPGSTAASDAVDEKRHERNVSAALFAGQAALTMYMGPMSVEALSGLRGSMAAEREAAAVFSAGVREAAPVYRDAFVESARIEPAPASVAEAMRPAYEPSVARSVAADVPVTSPIAERALEEVPPTRVAAAEVPREVAAEVPREAAPVARDVPPASAEPTRFTAPEPVRPEPVVRGAPESRMPAEYGSPARAEPVPEPYRAAPVATSEPVRAAAPAEPARLATAQQPARIAEAAPSAPLTEASRISTPADVHATMPSASPWRSVSVDPELRGSAASRDLSGLNRGHADLAPAGTPARDLGGAVEKGAAEKTAGEARVAENLPRAEERGGAEVRAVREEPRSAADARAPPESHAPAEVRSPEKTAEVKPEAARENPAVANERPVDPGGAGTSRGGNFFSNAYNDVKSALGFGGDEAKVAREAGAVADAAKGEARAAADARAATGAEKQAVRAETENALKDAKIAKEEKLAGKAPEKVKTAEVKDSNIYKEDKVKKAREDWLAKAGATPDHTRMPVARDANGKPTGLLGGRKIAEGAPRGPPGGVWKQLPESLTKGKAEIDRLSKLADDLRGRAAEYPGGPQKWAREAHVPEFVPDIAKLNDFTEKAIRAREPSALDKAKSFFGVETEPERRLRQLEAFKKEAADRVAREKVTYEWWNHYNDRQAILRTPEAERTAVAGGSQRSFTKDLLNTGDWQTAERYEAAAERARARDSFGGTTDYRVADEFPKHVTLPMVEGDLGIVPMNELMGKNVHVTGHVPEAVIADGREMWPDHFYRHDGVHANNEKFVQARDGYTQADLDILRDHYLAYRETLPLERREAFEYGYFVSTHELDYTGDLIENSGRSFVRRDDAVPLLLREDWLKGIAPASATTDEVAARKFLKDVDAELKNFSETMPMSPYREARLENQAEYLAERYGAGPRAPPVKVDVDRVVPTQSAVGRAQVLASMDAKATSARDFGEFVGKYKAETGETNRVIPGFVGNDLHSAKEFSDPRIYITDGHHTADELHTLLHGEYESLPDSVKRLMTPEQQKLLAADPDMRLTVKLNNGYGTTAEMVKDMASRNMGLLPESVEKEYAGVLAKACEGGRLTEAETADLIKAYKGLPENFAGIANDPVRSAIGQAMRELDLGREMKDYSQFYFARGEAKLALEKLGITDANALSPEIQSAVKQALLDHPDQLRELHRPGFADDGTHFRDLNHAAVDRALAGREEVLAKDASRAPAQAAPIRDAEPRGPPAAASAAEREELRAKAEASLGREISEPELDLVERAHNVGAEERGTGIAGKDGVNEAGKGNYRWDQIREKAEILKGDGKAAFTAEERRILMEEGVVGREAQGAARAERGAADAGRAAKETKPLPVARVSAAEARTTQTVVGESIVRNGMEKRALKARNFEELRAAYTQRSARQVDAVVGPDLRGGQGLRTYIADGHHNGRELYLLQNTPYKDLPESVKAKMTPAQQKLLAKDPELNLTVRVKNTYGDVDSLAKGMAKDGIGLFPDEIEKQYASVLAKARAGEELTAAETKDLVKAYRTIGGDFAQIGDDPMRSAMGYAFKELGLNASDMRDFAQFHLARGEAGEKLEKLGITSKNALSPEIQKQVRKIVLDHEEELRALSREGFAVDGKAFRDLNHEAIERALAKRDGTYRPIDGLGNLEELVGKKFKSGADPYLPRELGISVTRKQGDEYLEATGRLWKDYWPDKMLLKDLNAARDAGKISDALAAEVKEARSRLRSIGYLCEALCKDHQVPEGIEQLAKRLGRVESLAGSAKAEKVTGAVKDLLAALDDKPMRKVMKEIDGLRSAKRRANTDWLNGTLDRMQQSLKQSKLSTGEFRQMRKDLRDIQALMMVEAAKSGEPKLWSAFEWTRQAFKDLGNEAEDMAKARLIGGTYDVTRVPPATKEKLMQLTTSVRGGVNAEYEARAAERAVLRSNSEAALGRKISEPELDLIERAHEVGLDERGTGILGKDGEREAGKGNYRWDQIREKAEILKGDGKISFTAEERRILMDRGIVGHDVETAARPEPSFFSRMRGAAGDLAESLRQPLRSLSDALEASRADGELTRIAEGVKSYPGGEALGRDARALVDGTRDDLAAQRYANRTPDTLWPTERSFQERVVDFERSQSEFLKANAADAKAVSQAQDLRKAVSRNLDDVNERHALLSGAEREAKGPSPLRREFEAQTVPFLQKDVIPGLERVQKLELGANTAIRDAVENAGAIPLRYYKVPKDWVNVSSIGSLPPALKRTIFEDENTVRWFVHPKDSHFGHTFVEQRLKANGLDSSLHALKDENALLTSSRSSFLQKDPYSVRLSYTDGFGAWGGREANEDMMSGLVHTELNKGIFADDTAWAQKISERAKDDPNSYFRLQRDVARVDFAEADRSKALSYSFRDLSAFTDDSKRFLPGFTSYHPETSAMVSTIHGATDLPEKVMGKLDGAARGRAAADFLLDDKAVMASAHSQNVVLETDRYYQLTNRVLSRDSGDVFIPQGMHRAFEAEELAKLRKEFPYQTQLTDAFKNAMPEKTIPVGFSLSHGSKSMVPHIADTEFSNAFKEAFFDRVSERTGTPVQELKAISETQAGAEANGYYYIKIKGDTPTWEHVADLAREGKLNEVPIPEPKVNPDLARATELIEKKEATELAAHAWSHPEETAKALLVAKLDGADLKEFQGARTVIEQKFRAGEVKNPDWVARALVLGDSKDEAVLVHQMRNYVTRDFPTEKAFHQILALPNPSHEALLASTEIFSRTKNDSLLFPKAYLSDYAGLKSVDRDVYNALTGWARDTWDREAVEKLLGKKVVDRPADVIAAADRAPASRAAALAASPKYEDLSPLTRAVGTGKDVVDGALSPVETARNVLARRDADSALEKAAADVAGLEGGKALEAEAHAFVDGVSDELRGERYVLRDSGDAAAGERASRRAAESVSERDARFEESLDKFRGAHQKDPDALAKATQVEESVAKELAAERERDRILSGREHSGGLDEAALAQKQLELDTGTSAADAAREARDEKAGARAPTSQATGAQAERARAEAEYGRQLEAKLVAKLGLIPRIVEHSGGEVVALGRNGEKLGETFYHANKEVLHFGGEQLKHSDSRDDVDDYVRNSVLQEHPEARRVESRLSGADERTVRDLLRQGKSCEAAIRETRAGHLLAAYGFTKAVSADCQTMTYSFAR